MGFTTTFNSSIFLQHSWLLACIISVSFGIVYSTVATTPYELPLACSILNPSIFNTDVSTEIPYPCKKIVEERLPFTPVNDIDACVSSLYDSSPTSSLRDAAFGYSIRINGSLRSRVLGAMVLGWAVRQLSEYSTTTQVQRCVSALFAEAASYPGVISRFPALLACETRIAELQSSIHPDAWRAVSRWCRAAISPNLDFLPPAAAFCFLGDAARRVHVLKQFHENDANNGQQLREALLWYAAAVSAYVHTSQQEEVKIHQGGIQPKDIFLQLFSSPLLSTWQAYVTASHAVSAAVTLGYERMPRTAETLLFRNRQFREVSVQNTGLALVRCVAALSGGYWSTDWTEHATLASASIARLSLAMNVLMQLITLFIENKQNQRFLCPDTYFQRIRATLLGAKQWCRMEALFVDMPAWVPILLCQWSEQRLDALSNLETWCQTSEQLSSTTQSMDDQHIVNWGNAAAVSQWSLKQFTVRTARDVWRCCDVDSASQRKCFWQWQPRFRRILAQPGIENTRLDMRMNSTHNKMLRVAYLSSDFRQHTVGYSLYSMFAAHDRASVSVTCYHHGGLNKAKASNHVSFDISALQPSPLGFVNDLRTWWNLVRNESDCYQNDTIPCDAINTREYDTESKLSHGDDEDRKQCSNGQHRVPALSSTYVASRMVDCQYGLHTLRMVEACDAFFAPRYWSSSGTVNETMLLDHVRHHTSAHVVIDLSGITSDGIGLSSYRVTPTAASSPSHTIPNSSSPSTSTDGKSVSTSCANRKKAIHQNSNKRLARVRAHYLSAPLSLLRPDPVDYMILDAIAQPPDLLRESMDVRDDEIIESNVGGGTIPGNGFYRHHRRSTLGTAPSQRPSLLPALTESVVYLPPSFLVAQTYVKEHAVIHLLPSFTSSPSPHERCGPHTRHRKIFQFGSLLQPGKLEPLSFTTWMNALRRVHHSTLLLLDPSEVRKPRSHPISHQRINTTADRLWSATSLTPVHISSADVDVNVTTSPSATGSGTNLTPPGTVVPIDINDNTVESHVASVWCKRMRLEAAARGIHPLRIRCASKRPREQYLRLFQNVHVAFDARAFGGHTSSADATAANTPVLTLAGSRLGSRGTASLLAAYDRLLSSRYLHAKNRPHEYSSASQLPKNALSLTTHCVTHSLVEFEAQAVALSTGNVTPVYRNALRSLLSNGNQGDPCSGDNVVNNDTTASNHTPTLLRGVFDSAFVANTFERAYRAMWEVNCVLGDADIAGGIVLGDEKEQI